MTDAIFTSRLALHTLKRDDHPFMKELMNTPEWIKYIGDRNIKTEEQAKNYIQKIIDHPDFHYWTVRLQESGTPVGIITFLKRDNLDYPDIGFAFLPAFTKMGYAYEAAKAVLEDIKKTTSGLSPILAITIKENAPSIALLKKLGFVFDKEIEENNTCVMKYAS